MLSCKQTYCTRGIAMEKYIKTPITKEISETLTAGDYIYLPETVPDGYCTHKLHMQ